MEGSELQEEIFRVMEEAMDGSDPEEMLTNFSLGIGEYDEDFRQRLMGFVYTGMKNYQRMKAAEQGQAQGY